MRLIINIKKNPSRASKMKMEHFSQIGVTEVFLEATPRVYVLTVIFLSAFWRNGRTRTSGLYTQLYGNYDGGEYTTIVLFFLTYATSIMSAAFGISR